MFMYYMCLTEFAESERNWMNGILDPTNEIASRGAWLIWDRQTRCPSVEVDDVSCPLTEPSDVDTFLGLFDRPVMYIPNI